MPSPKTNFLPLGANGVMQQPFDASFQNENLKKDFNGRTAYNITKKLHREYQKIDKEIKKFDGRENLKSQEKNKLQELKQKKVLGEKAKIEMQKIGKHTMTARKYLKAMATVAKTGALGPKGMEITEEQIKKKIETRLKQKIKIQSEEREKKKQENIRMVTKKERDRKVEEAEKRLKEMRDNLTNDKKNISENQISDDNEGGNKTAKENTSPQTPAISTLPNNIEAREANRAQVSVFESMPRPNENNQNKTLIPTRQQAKKNIPSADEAEDLMID